MWQKVLWLISDSLSLVRSAINIIDFIVSSFFFWICKKIFYFFDFLNFFHRRWQVSKFYICWQWIHRTGWPIGCYSNGMWRSGEGWRQWPSTYWNEGSRPTWWRVRIFPFLSLSLFRFSFIPCSFASSQDNFIYCWKCIIYDFEFEGRKMPFSHLPKTSSIFNPSIWTMNWRMSSKKIRRMGTASTAASKPALCLSQWFLSLQPSSRNLGTTRRTMLELSVPRQATEETTRTSSPQPPWLQKTLKQVRFRFQLQRYKNDQPKFWPKSSQNPTSAISWTFHQVLTSLIHAIFLLDIMGAEISSPIGNLSCVRS